MEKCGRCSCTMCECAQCRCAVRLEVVGIVNFMFYKFYHNKKKNKKKKSTWGKILQKECPGALPRSYLDFCFLSQETCNFAFDLFCSFLISSSQEVKTGNWSSHSHRERWVADWNAQNQPLPVGLSTRSCHHMTRARELQPLLWGLLASPQLNPEWRVPCAPADSAHRGLVAGDPPPDQDAGLLPVPHPAPQALTGVWPPQVAPKALTRALPTCPAGERASPTGPTGSAVVVRVQTSLCSWHILPTSSRKHGCCRG